MQVIRGLATIAQIIIHYGSNTVWVRAGSPPDVGGALTWQPWSRVYHTGTDSRLEGVVQTTAGDLNTLVESGFYRLSNANTNAPPNNWNWSTMLVVRGADTIWQQIIHYETNTTWVRAGVDPDEPSMTWQPWSQVARLDGAQTWTAVQTFTGNPSILALSTDSGAGAGPELRVFRDSGSPAVNDSIGRVVFRGRDSAAAERNYGFVGGKINDPAAGSESASVYVAARRNGSYNDVAWFGDGAYMQGAAGGYQGPGSFNATALFVNGDPVPTLNVSHTWTERQFFYGQFPARFLWSDDTSSLGPYVRIARSSASPAANDYLGILEYLGRLSSGIDAVYAGTNARIVSPTAGSHSGRLEIRTAQSGTSATRAYVEDGVVVGTPTNGDQGAGTINLQQAPYVNGAALASSHLAGFDRGTWVPALSGGTVAGGIVHTVQEGFYITDGEWVKAFFNIEAYIGAGTAPSGNLLVSLPFTAAEAAWVSAGVVHEADNAAVGSNFAGWGIRRHSTTAGRFTVQNANTGDMNNADAPTVLSSSSGSPTRLQGCIEYIR